MYLFSAISISQTYTGQAPLLLKNVSKFASPETVTQKFKNTGNADKFQEIKELPMENKNKHGPPTKIL
ncbi:MAG: hypothetical protein DRH32_09605, partial [Deltaproteobacteria bacterium]